MSSSWSGTCDRFAREYSAKCQLIFCVARVSCAPNGIDFFQADVLQKLRIKLFLIRFLFVIFIRLSRLYRLFKKKTHTKAIQRRNLNESKNVVDGFHYCSIIMSSVHWCWPVEKLFLIVYLVHGASERFHIFDCGQTRRIPNRQTNLHPGEYTFISAQLFIYMFSLYVARKCRQGIFLVAFLRAPFENATRQCCIKFIRQRPKSNNIEAIVSLSSKNNNNNHK